MTRRVPGTLALLPLLVVACRTSPPALDHHALLERQAWRDNRDQDWYEANIPFFDSPDSSINSTYYYRWEVVTKHRTYGSPETGYTFSEFIDRPFWSGAYGAISCPLGHQMYEVRWLRDRRYVEDFARYWFETPGAEPRSYSNWYGDAVWASYLVNGDSAWLHHMLPHMQAQYAGWVAEHWDSTHRMFRWDGMHDGMETNINSRLTSDEFAGAEGYRPTLNSYLFADARAISHAAALFGDTALAGEYAARAGRLKARVQQELWDPARQFFFHQFARDEKGGIRAGTLTYASGPLAGNPHGRELIGYVPWQFSLPDSGYEAAWRFLMDTSAFQAPFGPTTVERHDPQFLVSPTCCVWSGNEWPYATSQTLTAMANLLNNYRQDVVTRSDYVRLLKTFTHDQRKNGRPYIAEAANPETGSWSGHDTFDHSEHYFHSSYVDLIITGLVGLRPRADDTLEVNPLVPADWNWFALDDVAYHGHQVTIAWDRDGMHYGKGKGLSLYVDGRRVARHDSIGRLTASLGKPRGLAPVDRPVNWAVNNGRGEYPRVSASYSAPATPPFYLNDGQSWYDASPPDRWTASGSGHVADTVTIDFGVIRPIEWVSLYFLDDGDSIRPPAAYSLEQYRDGRWTGIPGQQKPPGAPEGRRATVIRFDRIETSRIRLVVRHQPGASSGLTEFEAWAHASPPFPAAVEKAADLALNSSGAAYPRATASFTEAESNPSQAIDGRIALSLYSRNRWSARGTPHATDWLQVDLGQPRRVDRIELYLVGSGGSLAAPESYHVEYLADDGWHAANERRRLPERPMAPALNTVWIEPVRTSGIRVMLHHARPAASAVSELLIEGDGT